MPMVILAIGLIFLGAGVAGFASEFISDKAVEWFERASNKFDSLLGE